MKVKLDLFNYRTKSDMKSTASAFVKKDDLAGLKSDVDKSDIDKLKTVLTNLNNLTFAADENITKLKIILVDLEKL